MLVCAGTELCEPSAGRWVVDPEHPEHFSRLLEQAPWRDRGVLRGVVHLWSLDIASPHDATALHEGDRLGVASTLHLAQALIATGWTGALWLATRGAQQVTKDDRAESLNARAAGVWGLGGAIAAEHPELQVRRLDLDAADDTAECAARLSSALLAMPQLRDTALRAGRYWCPLLQRRRVFSTAHAAQRLEVVRAGTLDGIALRPLRSAALQVDEVRVEVRAAGLNFRDVLLALDMYPDDVVPLGAECAGIVREVGSAVSGFAIGDEVFGYAPSALASETAVPAAFLAKLPPRLGMDGAAALPVAFLTAYYGLHRLAHLRRGERVLIHAAAGGVGLAAVQLAQRCGATIFATAGSEPKRELLRSLGIAHIMDSRSLDFAEQVAAATSGRGVDVVLNSLAGDFAVASLRTLAPNGRFLELGKRDVLTPQAAAEMRPDVAYHVFDLGREAQADRGLLRPMFDELLAAFDDGSLRPLPVTTYALDDAHQAFRCMAQGRHIGKIVLKPRRDAASGIVSPTATYWITGGLGALGLATARWLVECGARQLVLSGRSAPDAAASRSVKTLEALGAQVRIVAADAADRPRMQQVLDEIVRDLPPLRGVIHAAGTVSDAVLLRQRWPDARAVLRGKAHGAWVLHDLTRDLPLDFFIMYSAAGVLLGARGQGAYPAANAELDALARLRRRLGLPALAVAWGVWDAGMAAADGQRWAERGLQKITPDAGFARLETLLRDGASHAAVLAIDWSRFLDRLPEGVDPAFFAAVAPRQPEAPPRPAQEPTLVEQIASLPASQRGEALTSHLAERARRVLGLDAATTIDRRVPLKDIGLDSLMAVELRNALARSLGRALPATLLFDYPTLDALSGHLARSLQLVDEDAAVPRTATPAHADLATISDAEAEALLLAELDGVATGATP
jgi:NADPH:quinone reductase-like Zn-dependent oxidoreductase